MISVLDLPTAQNYTATLAHIKNGGNVTSTFTVNFYSSQARLDGGLVGQVSKIQFDKDAVANISQNDLIDINGKTYRIVSVIERFNPAFKPFVECEVKEGKDEKMSLI